MFLALRCIVRIFYPGYTPQQEKNETI